MADKVLNTRVQQKHDIEANWLKATNFIPKIGEVIVYDPDENHAAARVKIGDGVRTVGQLPFISEQADWNVNNESSAAYVKNRTHYVYEDSGILCTPSEENIELYNTTVSNWKKCDEIKDNTLLIINGLIRQGRKIEKSEDESYAIYGDILFVFEPNVVIEDLTFLTTGIYVTEENIDNEPIYYDVSFVQQIDEAYIPDSIARVNEIPVIYNSNWTANGLENGYIENRSHYEINIDLNYDGDYSNKNYKPSSRAGQYWIKVSETPYSYEELLGAQVSGKASGNDYSLTIEENRYWRREEKERYCSLYHEGKGCDILSVKTFYEEGGVELDAGLWILHRSESTYISSIVKNYIHQLDEKFIPDSIARKEDLVQSDWNENDETALSYVKNRTHWEEELEPIVIFEEQEVELVADRYVALSNHLGFVLKPNTKYRAIFNGKEYEGVSYYTNEYKDNIYLFNELYNNDNPDDIFCITTFLHNESGEEPATYLEVRDEDEGTYTFALYELTTNVHQLDPKFIPTASEEQLIQLLMDIDALPAMTDSNGAIFTHKDSILLI